MDTLPTNEIAGHMAVWPCACGATITIWYEGDGPPECGRAVRHGDNPEHYMTEELLRDRYGDGPAVVVTTVVEHPRVPSTHTVSGPWIDDVHARMAR